LAWPAIRFPPPTLKENSGGRHRLKVFGLFLTNALGAQRLSKNMIVRQIFFSALFLVALFAATGSSAEESLPTARSIMLSAGKEQAAQPVILAARRYAAFWKKLNPAYRQVAITSSPNEISVTVDNQPPLRTPAKSAPVAWVGPDGGKVNASMQLAGRRLAQTFTSADGRRVNDYTLSPDGRTLIMQVTETSPRLSQTITYKQVYRRVS
jgi:hypothetical protein